MLYNIKELKWDNKILKELDIPESICRKLSLPARFTVILMSGFRSGNTHRRRRGRSNKPALFGQACYTSGMAKNTYGTGCFLLMLTGEKLVHSQNGLLTTIAWGINNKVEYALEGSIFVAGAARPVVTRQHETHL